MANITTPEFRVSFPNVFKPGKSMEEGKEGKYNVTMLFDKDTDISALKAAAADACIAKWGDKSKWPKNLRTPFRDQGEKDFDGYVEGSFFVNATSGNRPGLVDKKLNPIIDPSDFYPGCYARASINAFAYDKAGNKGVAFGLNHIQKLRDGDPLGSFTRPEDVFAPIADGDGSKDEGDDPFN